MEHHNFRAEYSLDPMLRVTSGISGMLPRLYSAPAAAASDLAEALHDTAERVR